MADIRVVREWRFSVTAEPGEWPDMQVGSWSSTVIRPDILRVRVVMDDTEGAKPGLGSWEASGYRVKKDGSLSSLRSDAKRYGCDSYPDWVVELADQCVATAVSEVKTWQED